MTILDKNKASVYAIFKYDFLGKPQMIFFNGIESHNPEKLPVCSTLCSWGKEKWPFCICLEMASNWEWGQLCLWPNQSLKERVPWPHPSGPSSAQILGSWGPLGWGIVWHAMDQLRESQWHRDLCPHVYHGYLWAVFCPQSSIFFFVFIVLLLMLFENNHILQVSFENF